MKDFEKITTSEVLRRERLADERKSAVIAKAKQAYACQVDFRLNETVEELKQVEAVEINHQGIDAQLKYIIDRAGVSFLEDIIG